MVVDEVEYRIGQEFMYWLWVEGTDYWYPGGGIFIDVHPEWYTRSRSTLWW